MFEEIDTQLMQHTQEFFDAIFGEVFRQNDGYPISSEQFRFAVTAICAEPSE